MTKYIYIKKNKSNGSINNNLALLYLSRNDYNKHKIRIPLIFNKQYKDLLLKKKNKAGV
jgi:hypothetical protein